MRLLGRADGRKFGNAHQKPLVRLSKSITRRTQLLDRAQNQMIERCPGKGRSLATKGLFSKVVAYDVDQVFSKMSFKW